MQIANIPLKFYVPFAQNDSSRVEIPITTTDTTRASQSLGFPPLTMQPPESGGVPPQGEDFNGAMNQIARIAWWLMAGGPFVYDATFASNSNINGYPQGARVTSSDYLGAWLCLADNNQNNPDTLGTNWVPGYSYGQTSIALTNSNVTLTPLQASKRILVFTGTLTGNVVITLPAWVYDWKVVNNTTGAFTLTITTAGGSGFVLAQGGSARARGDGVNINLDAQQVGAATALTHAMQLGQATGRLLRTTVYNTAGTFTFTSLSNTSFVEIEGTGGGGAGGGASVTSSSQVSMGSGGGSAAYAKVQMTSAFSGGISVTVGAGGVGSAGATGGNGGTTSFGSAVTIPGGGGGGTTLVSSTSAVLQSANQGGPGSLPTFGSGVSLQIVVSRGQPGLNGMAVGASGFSGQGAPSVYGGGAANNAGTTGAAAVTAGAGGAGGFNGTGGAVAWAGGNGGPGLLIIREYA